MSGNVPCGSPNWGERYSTVVNVCVTAGPGQGCDERGGRCGSCFRGRAKAPHSPILLWFGGLYVHVVKNPGNLSQAGIQEGDFLWEIEGEQVDQDLISLAAQSSLPLKVRYYRPGQASDQTVEAPAGAIGLTGFQGLALSTPGPLEGYGVSQWDVLKEIGGQWVTAELLLDLAAEPTGHASTVLFWQRAAGIDNFLELA